MSFEYPLVFFTVLTQLATGLAFFLCWQIWINPDETGKGWQQAWLWTGALSAIGLIASLCHLGQPFSAWKALYNLGASSLSWEALGFACFTFLAFLVFFLPTRGWALLAAITGAFSLVTQGMTYAPPSMPAINNAFPMAIFWLSAFTLGASGITLIRKPESSLAGRIAIIALMAVMLIAPAIWTSGSITMANSASLWLNSGWFWCGVVLIALALAATWFDKGYKSLRFASLFIGIFFTRMVFFADTVHTAQVLGLPFN